MTSMSSQFLVFTFVLVMVDYFNYFILFIYLFFFCGSDRQCL